MKIFDFGLEAKIVENSLGYVRINDVEEQLENMGYNPSFDELIKLDEQLAKEGKVTSSKLAKLWIETYAISPKATKIENNGELKRTIESQENWVNKNKDFLKFWGVM
jgi:hypothetical protein